MISSRSCIMIMSSFFPPALILITYLVVCWESKIFPLIWVENSNDGSFAWLFFCVCVCASLIHRIVLETRRWNRRKKKKKTTTLKRDKSRFHYGFWLDSSFGVSVLKIEKKMATTTTTKRRTENQEKDTTRIAVTCKIRYEYTNGNICLGIGFVFVLCKNS